MQTYFNTTHGKTTHLNVYFSDRDIHSDALLADKILVLQLKDSDGYVINFPICKWLAELILKLLGEKDVNTS